MILPGSHTTVFILLILGMLGWGLWANTYKSAGSKWRFELFYFDFAIGVVIAAAVVALTAGSLGFDGFSLLDDLRLAGKRQDLFGLLAGGIFNLGNMLLLAAVSLAGMSVAFPVALGFALVVAASWDFALNRGGNAVFLFAGAGLVLAAVVLAILTSKASAFMNPAPPAQPVKGKVSKKSNGKSIALSIAGGLLLGSFWPFIQKGMSGENGLGPYSLGLIFAIGVLFSTFVFNLFFMNLPVEGEPVDIADYFRAKFSRHALGLLGGVIWYAGIIAVLIAARIEGPAQVSTSWTFGLRQGAIVVATLCGVFLWREFPTRSDVKMRLVLMLLLMVAGIGLAAAGIAPAAVAAP